MSKVKKEKDRRGIEDCLRNVLRAENIPLSRTEVDYIIDKSEEALDGKLVTIGRNMSGRRID